jgi:hypothetical protein
MKKHNKQVSATQLSLFAPEEKKTPAPLSQPTARQETSEEEIIAIKQRFLALGKHFGYPHVKFVDPRTSFMDTDRREVELFQGLDAWKKCLEQESIEWIMAFTKWLEAGKIYDSVFIHMIRKGREDMLLHYAMLKHYPEMQIGDLLIGEGQDAWKSAAKALDRATLEDAIDQLAKGEK